DVPQPVPVASSDPADASNASPYSSSSLAMPHVTISAEGCAASVAVPRDDSSPSRALKRNDSRNQRLAATVVKPTTSSSTLSPHPPLPVSTAATTTTTTTTTPTTITPAPV